MAQVIVEMEMPKRCINCGVRLKCKRYVCGLQQDIAEDLNPLMGDKDCNIKGVLPDEHGDLVDKETAKNAFDSSFLTFRMKDGETMRGFYQRTIDELPVLIAAERKDDGKSC